MHSFYLFLYLFVYLCLDTAQCSIQFDLPPQYPDTVPLFSILSQSQNISSTEPLLQVLQEQVSVCENIIITEA